MSGSTSGDCKRSHGEELRHPPATAKTALGNGRRSRLDAAPTAHSQPRALLRSVAPPEFRWVTQRGIHVHGGAGLRLSISQRVFLAPEVRIGLPGVAFDGRGRLRLRALIRPDEAASVGGENWTRDRIGCDRGRMVVHERLDAAGSARPRRPAWSIGPRLRRGPGSDNRGIC